MSREIETILVNVISGYAPQVECSLGEKDNLWNTLDRTMAKLLVSEEVCLVGELNGNNGEGNNGTADVMERYGLGEKNEEGCRIIEFTASNQLAIVNIYFRKRR